MSAALSIQRSTNSSPSSSAMESWTSMEKNAFPGSETLLRSTPSHPQPDFLSIVPTEQPMSSSGGTQRRHLTGENTTTCTPWVRKEYPCTIVGLHEEILHFYSYIYPRRSERYMRLQVVDKIKRIILGLWPNAQVHVFGSLFTSLYLPTSDIDIVVFGDWVVPFPLFSLEEAICKAEIAVEDSIVVLDKTTVPIIKFTDKATEVKLDISFNRIGGLRAATVICQYIEEFPLLPPLLMVVKQFLVQRQLNEIYFGGINSYSLVLMLISFFQNHARSEAIEPTANLGVLLIEFFELYGRQFNYTKVGISVNNGGYYFPKDSVEGGMEDCLLYIQDPTEPQDNACRGCYGIMQVKSSFEHAFSSLHKAILVREEPVTRSTSLLSSIIQIKKEVDDYRNWVESEWPSSAIVTSPPPYSLTTSTLLSPIGLVQPYIIGQPLSHHHTSSTHQGSDHTST